MPGPKDCISELSWTWKPVESRKDDCHSAPATMRRPLLIQTHCLFQLRRSSYASSGIRAITRYHRLRLLPRPWAPENSASSHRLSDCDSLLRVDSFTKRRSTAEQPPINLSRNNFK